MNPALYSSARDDWETPQAFFDKANQEFGPFTLDVCAYPHNYKVERYFSKYDTAPSAGVDGLAQSWAGETCWMNPPYGREIGKWIQKAAMEARTPGTLVVCLIPARVDTSWWHLWIWDGRTHTPYPGVEVRFCRGRLKFEGAEHYAPFPSALVIFGRK